MNEQYFNGEDSQFNDINWYFHDSNKYIVSVASAGGKLPDFINETISSNDIFHSHLLKSKPRFEIDRNPELEKYINISDIENKKKYYGTFDELASRGVYAFDKMDISSRDDGRYILVSYPANYCSCSPYFCRHHLEWMQKKKLNLPRFDIEIIKGCQFKRPFENNFEPINIVDVVNNSNRYIYKS